MPKQLIEVDVPDGFEVDSDLYCKVRPCFSVNNFSIMIPFRRKLSYETAPPRTSVCSNYAFGIDMAAEGAKDFTACYSFTLDELRGVSVVPDPDYKHRETRSLGWNRHMGVVSLSVLDLGTPEIRRPHFLLSKGERWPWVDCDDPIAVTVRHVERIGARTIPLYLKTSMLTASAQPPPPEPVSIESDLSEQVTRLLRHLGIDVPPTAAEVDDLVRCTLNSLRAENWIDLGERLLPQIKEIHLGDGKSVRVSGEIHRDDWQWPEWLNKEWLFLTQRGVWMAGNDEPELRYGDWWIKAFSGTWEAMSPDFVPPPCTDWRQSKRRNPQWKD